MTWGLLFLALSPSVYMMTPQLTEQYGQVLRVSVVRASLKLRTCARTACGENPIIARLEPASPAPQTLKNCLRLMSIWPPPLVSIFRANMNAHAEIPDEDSTRRKPKEYEYTFMWHRLGHNMKGSAY